MRDELAGSVSGRAPAAGTSPVLPSVSRSTQMSLPTFVPIGRVTPPTSTGIAWTLASAPLTTIRAPVTSPYASSSRRRSGASCSATSEILRTRAGTPGCRSESATSSPYGASRPGTTLPCGQVVGCPRVSSSRSATRSDTPEARRCASSSAVAQSSPRTSVSQRSSRRCTRTIFAARSSPAGVRVTLRSAPISTNPSRARRCSVTVTVGALTPSHSASRPGRTRPSSWRM